MNNNNNNNKTNNTGNQEEINKIKIGTFTLPGGFETAYGILENILQYLDVKSLFNVIRSSLINQICNSEDCKRIINKHPGKKLYLLIEKYKADFPLGMTPIVCACECGRMDDVELFVNLHPFHKYITNRVVNGYRDDMTLKEYVNQEGEDRGGKKYTPLMAAAQYEHFQVVEYLIEQCEADPNITNSMLIK